jgi:hypothetical protein
LAGGAPPARRRPAGNRYSQAKNPSTRTTNP